MACSCSYSCGGSGNSIAAMRELKIQKVLEIIKSKTFNISIKNKNEEVDMGCGCNKNNNRNVRNTPAVTLNTTSSNRRIVSSAPPPTVTPENLANPSVMDQDRLRIERLRREAQRRALGR